MQRGEHITQDAIRVLAVLVTLQLCVNLFGLANALTGLVMALVVVAWRVGLYPFPRR